MVAVKGIPRPDCTELSRGQNKVRIVAASPEMSCNTTPTWQKMPRDKFVNAAYVSLSFAGIGVMVRAVQLRLFAFLAATRI